MEEKQLIVALEIGGTSMRAALVDEKASIVALLKKRTPLFSSRAVVGGAEELIDKLLEEHQVDSTHILGIGMGIAGMINFKEGIVVFSPNLPLRNVPFRDLIRDFYQIPTFLDNDANVAALGEKYYGLGREVSNFVCLTLGTGIGAGLILENKIYRGTTGSAAELGHTIIDMDGLSCTCGSYGCFEELASGRAIVRKAKEAVERERGERLLELANGKEKNLTGELVTQAALQGDSASRSILNEIGRIIGIGITNIVNIFNPELVVISGGVAKAGDLILEPARRVVSEQALIPNSQVVRIEVTTLGDKIGVLGAAALALNELAVI